MCSNGLALEWFDKHISKSSANKHWLGLRDNLPRIWNFHMTVVGFRLYNLGQRQNNKQKCYDKMWFDVSNIEFQKPTEKNMCMLDLHLKLNLLK